MWQNRKAVTIEILQGAPARVAKTGAEFKMDKNHTTKAIEVNGSFSFTYNGYPCVIDRPNVYAIRQV